MLDEIRLELKEPAQQVQDILDSEAPEAELRKFLRRFTADVERMIAEEFPKRST